MTALDDAPASTTRDAPASTTWVGICRLDDLIVGRGVAALVGDRQVALFRLSADPSAPELRAVDNIDPYGRAAVMSRGLVGDRGGIPTVASPLLKQVFSLDTGVCLDDESVALATFDVRVVDSLVEVRGC